MRERLLGHRLAAPVVERILRDRRAGARRASAGPVRIVMLSAYGMGGTIRTVLNLAGHLAGRYEVEIVCVFRYRDEAFFDLPAGVRIHVLDDRRPGARGGRLRPLLARIPSVLMHPDDFAVGHFTVWTDVRLLRRLRSWRSGAVITTRPAFGLFAARFARAGVVLVAQEHLNLSAYSEELRRELAERYAAVDLVAALTRSDCEDYRRLLAATGTRVERVPNAVPRVPGEPRAERAKVVLAAGRLSVSKGFDLLIAAFAPVAERHPDWRLVIHGDGGERPQLERLVAEHGLDGRVELARPSPRLGEVMAESAIFALSSRYEGFPMVLLEAMSKGMAIVAFDCPTGPREAISDGRDGLLVPPEDVGALSDALLRAIEDPSLREGLGAAALQTAREYDVEAIGRRWETLLGELGVPPRG